MEGNNENDNCIPLLNHETMSPDKSNIDEQLSSSNHGEDK